LTLGQVNGSQSGDSERIPLKEEDIPR